MDLNFVNIIILLVCLLLIGSVWIASVIKEKKLEKDAENLSKIIIEDDDLDIK